MESFARYEFRRHEAAPQSSKAPTWQAKKRLHDDVAEGDTSIDTFPKLLLKNARVRGRRPAMREKDYGIWQSWTWREVASEVRALACGLAALGFKPEDKLAIIGDNRPQLYWAMVAAQTVGGVPVPLYQDSVAEEMQYILEKTEAAFALVEDQEQVDKLLEIKERCPLDTIIYENPRGLRHYDQPFLHAFAAVQERGRAFDKENPSFFESRVAAGKGTDLAIMLYTSGTTGRPKGVMLSYDNLIATARNGIELERLTDKDEVLAYLPMAWVGDHLFSFAQSYVVGFCVSCPESTETVLTDMREIGPSYFFGPPRIFENILTTVLIRMEAAGRIKRGMFRHFMDVAHRTGIRNLEKKPVGLNQRILYELGRWLIYKPLMDTLGFSHLRVAYTAGEAIGPDVFNFYRSLGMNLKQIYGQTEASVFVTIQRDGQVKADTVGTPAKDVEIRITDGGEVVYRSPGVFMGYYKNDQATQETKTADGWVHTGDTGYFDADGHLKIIDRANDVGKLSDGSLLAPKYLENKLRFFPYIKEAVTFGDNRSYVVAIINIDLQAVGDWAERRGLPYSGYTDLASRKQVYELIQECVEKVNRDLAQETHLTNSQIQKFLILHKELDADDAELTRTRKVRRGFIAEKYADLIDALYSDRHHCPVKARVTFEDGRTAIIDADLAIREARRFGVGEMRLRKAG